MKKFLKLLTGRLFTFLTLLALQIAALVWLTLNFMNASAYYIPIVYTMAFISVFFIVSRDDNPVFKISWILVILVAPIFGVPFYMIFGNKRVGRQVYRQIAKYQEHYEKEMRAVLPEPVPSVRTELLDYSANLCRQSDYIRNLTGSPAWDNTAVEYFPLGEDAFARILQEVGKATRFILFEYFIVEEGEMWTAMLAALREKLDEGVSVRIMYDDLGSIQTLPVGYEKALQNMGFKTGVFNRIKPHLNAKLNYRDHRKILIIDGDVGFTGGINFADEYINRKIRFGHWKDSTVMLKGDAVWNLTLMFFQQWMFTTGEDVDLTEFTPRRSFPSDGFVQPFGDSPLDGENISENAYIQIINHARRYVWITTPYLIIDTQMATALIIAAQSGVDVRIVTPNFPDKWYVHPVTRSNYLQLLQAGVRIFEYTPGFIHAKMFVSDDEVSIVGSTNMDYRSFYMHFECGVAFFRSSIATHVRNDIAKSLDLCTEINLLDEESISLPVRLGRNILKLFSPLM
ncbi:MAG TPA: cardiolipin synthase [Sphaerochaeta sp.]|jgi:cardiolipin synthase|nr:MAG: cardiolipin synthase [Spirochaetes bacterium GWC2_52_13]PKL22330.1 MAG: cardiolipin synthase [Spirochaetae bacterium HGW-Spirochaetae-4]HCG63784.1 cardiolipin synthase [Sphaerochaeta sp.]HCJ94208.1 cardiolipin synthase [Sphaerochaeta sp.]HCS35333.1 cardiolipin synthase [Sphaerochaeta sp.]